MQQPRSSLQSGLASGAFTDSVCPHSALVLQLEAPPTLRLSRTEPPLHFAGMSHASHCDFSVMAQIMLEDSAWLDHHHPSRRIVGSQSACARAEDDGCATLRAPSLEHHRAANLLHTTYNTYVENEPNTMAEDGGCMIAEFSDRDGKPAAAQSILSLFSRFANSENACLGKPSSLQPNAQ